MDRSGDPFAKFVNNAIEKIAGVNVTTRDDQSRDVRMRRDEEFMRRVAEGLGGFAARIEQLSDNTRAIFSAIERLGDVESRLTRSYDIEDSLRRRSEELAASEADARVEIARLKGELALAENNAEQLRKAAEKPHGNGALGELSDILKNVPGDTERAIRECFDSLRQAVEPAISGAVKDAIRPADEKAPDIASAFAGIEENLAGKLSAAVSAAGDRLAGLLSEQSNKPGIAQEILDRIASALDKIETAPKAGASDSAIEQLRADLAAGSELAAALESEKSETAALRRAVEAEREETARLSAALNAIERELDEQRGRSDDDNLAIGALGGELAAEKAASAELRIAADTLRAELETLKTQGQTDPAILQGYEKTLLERDEKITALEAEKAASAELRIAADALLAEIETLKAKGQADPSVVQGYEKILLERDEKIASLEAEASKLAEEIENVRAQLTEAVDAGRRAMAREASRDSEIAEAWRECEKLQAKIKELESRPAPEPEVDNTQLNALMEEREHALTRISRLERENAEMAESITELKKREEGAVEVDRLVKATLADAESRANKLRDELAILEREKETLTQKYSDEKEEASKALSSAEARHDELKIAFGHLENRNRELEELAKMRESETATLRSALKERTDAHKAEIETLHEYIGEQHEMLEYYIERHRAASKWGPLAKVFDRFSASHKSEAAPLSPDDRPAAE